MSSNPAEAAATALGLSVELLRHGPVSSVAEAAQAQGAEVRDLVKTLVVRRADDDYVFVLVPGDRSISWPKLRALLGVNRLSMPDAATAKAATGYERGTITPFGSARAWPVIADSRTRNRTIHLGAGERGVGLRVAVDEAVAALGGTFADVTDEAVGSSA
ncbi:aminoacyl-tRNA deacylase [Actinoplanes sp. URMC 104]|uniref:aminoacyl-tRNA deacylase n=1 Tax=Actinoplanes sp. URMC 104 TaxID=3423409 RepID=UPI003F1CF645